MAGVESTRRAFLRRTAGTLLALGAAPAARVVSAEQRSGVSSPNDRAGIAAIGLRYQGTVIAGVAREFGDVVAICDVDRRHGETARKHFETKAPLYGDYRKVLERRDVDVVTIATPDHWHTAIAAAACRAGKHVYCEKPLTLTIDEGKHLRRVVRESGRTFQVGSWQRSDHRFRLACEMARAGRIGKLRRVEVVLGKNPTGGPFPALKPPPELDWDFWQGQTPAVAYREERCHYKFRWWLEYSGGQMTDWGAHHVDIAQWGAGVDRTGPVRIDGKAEYPTVENGYNVPVGFSARFAYRNGLVLTVSDTGRNGVTFVGERGSLRVDRGSLSSDPAGILAEEAIERADFRIYDHDNRSRPPRTSKRPATRNHMGNFFDCIAGGFAPISDVASQHRSVSTCHLANISMRLGRPLQWDPERERFVGDPEADRRLGREQRAPYLVTT